MKLTIHLPDRKVTVPVWGITQSPQTGVQQAIARLENTELSILKTPGQPWRPLHLKHCPAGFMIDPGE